MLEVKNQNPALSLIVALIAGPVSAIIGGVFLMIASRESPAIASAIESLANAIKRQPPAIVYPIKSLENVFTEELPAENIFTEELPTENVFTEELPAENVFTEELPPPLPLEVVSKYPEMLEYFEPGKDDVYVRMEKLARHLSDSGLFFKESSVYYAWLSKQAGLKEERKTLHLNNLKYVSGRWASSVDFIHDIADNLVTAVITDDPTFPGNSVNVRQSPEVISGNIIGSFNFHEEVQVLQRGDRQQINGSIAHWYLVRRAADGKEGWVYGQFLSFYLDT